MRFPLPYLFLISCVILLGIVLWPAEVRARESAAAERKFASLCTPDPACSVLLADESSWSWSKLFKPLEYLQGSRRKMIQLATLALCVALYIIWWRK